MMNTEQLTELIRKGRTGGDGRDTAGISCR